MGSPRGCPPPATRFGSKWPPPQRVRKDQSAGPALSPDRSNSLMRISRHSLTASHPSSEASVGLATSGLKPGAAGTAQNPVQAAVRAESYLPHVSPEHLRWKGIVPGRRQEPSFRSALGRPERGSVVGM